ncbi:bifunctional 3-deoxy-7-phosphoheptulonate synthase/chorismate mutase [Anaerosalibacter sp. Marseille-P3206]|uniref:bifunctional 3-deoxy-7-phosphoheptulonate synthase/chorismate mutase n=1 Tax=Anaerosalibacter sp. Marseille-P3206 TaxID=1871005 RepID=UPI000987515B|nr:bifunctional 3-deoxy-7-phosphoheptulonate synthase/chorismate mutase [Anaerosalibacter sp. Marseille-P3206]
MTKNIKLDNDTTIGNKDFNIMAGPCAVESEEQMDRIGKFLSSIGIKILRGGAFKPRTNPNTFQGLEYDGLKILKAIKEKYGLLVVSEIMDPRDVELGCEYIDIIQIGSRNMQNFALLKEVGSVKKPVLLKRGMSATIEEWLMAAEYIRLEGNEDIILCERGIRTFSDYTRNTLDLVSVPIIKNLSEYPIIIDPSHGTGRRELIIPATKAALAIGADGIIVEVHPEPSKALSDGDQSLDFDGFKVLVDEIEKLKVHFY